MTVVVTGASGHLGGNLVRALLAKGLDVRALVHRDRRALQGLDVEIALGDVCEPASLDRAFDGAAVVYHAAGHVSILDDEWPLLCAVNVEGARNVVEACLRCGVKRLIHFSSIHALELVPGGCFVDESAPLVKSTCLVPYSRSKAEGERAVRAGMARGLDAVVLYPTAMVGPHDYRPSHQGQFLLALARRRLPALVDGGFDWVDVRDVADGAIRAAESALVGARYLLSGHWVTAQDLAATVQRITGVRAPRLVAPRSVAWFVAPLFTKLARVMKVRPLFTRMALDALCSQFTASHERATQDLGYCPRPFQETLSASLKWFAESGQLARPLVGEPGEAL
jgi:dihydroflavonol-4-reductase